jgi:hypothetical protein
MSFFALFPTIALESNQRTKFKEQSTKLRFVFLGDLCVLGGLAVSLQ